MTKVVWRGEKTEKKWVACSAGGMAVSLAAWMAGLTVWMTACGWVAWSARGRGVAKAD